MTYSRFICAMAACRLDIIILMSASSLMLTCCPVPATFWVCCKSRSAFRWDSTMCHVAPWNSTHQHSGILLKTRTFKRDKQQCKVRVLTLRRRRLTYSKAISDVTLLSLPLSTAQSCMEQQYSQLWNTAIRKVLQINQPTKNFLCLGWYAWAVVFFRYLCFCWIRCSLFRFLHNKQQSISIYLQCMQSIGK